jgi:hypothetical protein
VADQRIKGQEVQALLIVDGEVKDTITDIRSFEVELQTEILREGYLGETTDRRDEVFKGVRGRIELHFENQDVFDLFQQVVNRARRRQPGTTINVKASLNFPNGQRKLVIVENIFFGPIPMAFANRADYGTISLDFESESLSFQ